MKNFFHEIPNKEYKSILNLTWGEINKKYKQPAWCKYPDAISPLGCWSLTSAVARKQISKEYCKTCHYWRGKND